MKKDNDIYLNLYNASRSWMEAVNDHYKYKLSKNSKSIILLYGETQMGKTSLTLHLIGIRHEKYKELDRLLRGEQGLGDSATPVATMYYNSGSDKFAVGVKNINSAKDSTEEKQVSVSEIKQEITRIRKRMENKGWNSSDYFSIGIPECYFDKAKYDAFPVDIVDFPGKGSKNEKVYIEETLRKFRLIASVVILVSSAQRPKNFEQPVKSEGLRYDINPHKYIMVSTKFFKVDSKRNGLKQIGHQKKEPQKKDIFDYVKWAKKDNLSEIKKAVEKNFETQIESMPSYYVLEFKADETLRDMGEPYISAIEEFTQKEIEDMRSEIVLRKNYSIFDNIEEIRTIIEEELNNELVNRREKKEELEDKIEKARERIDTLKNQQQNYEGEIEKAQGRYDEAKEKLDNIRNGFLATDYYVKISDIVSSGDIQKKHKDFKSVVTMKIERELNKIDGNFADLIETAYEPLSSYHEEPYEREKRERLKREALNTFKNCLNAVHSQISECIDQYMSPLLARNETKNRNFLEYLCDHCDLYFKEIAKRANGIMDKRCNCLEDDKKKFEQQKKRCGDLSENSGKEIDEKNAEIEDNEKKVEEIKEELRKIEGQNSKRQESLEKVLNVIEEKYTAYRREIIKRINHANNGNEKFMLSMVLRLSDREYENLKEHYK